MDTEVAAVRAHARQLFEAQKGAAGLAAARQHFDQTLLDWVDVLAAEDEGLAMQGPQLPGAEEATATAADSSDSSGNSSEFVSARSRAARARAVSSLWIEWAALEKELKQWKQAVKTYDQACACKVASPHEDVWLSYSAFCVDRGKCSNALKHLTRALARVQGADARAQVLDALLSLKRKHLGAPDLTLRQLRRQLRDVLVEAEGDAFADEEESDKEEEEVSSGAPSSSVPTLETSSSAAPSNAASAAASTEDGADNTSASSDAAEFVGVATPESVLAANYAAAQASGQVVSLGDEEGAPGEKEAADGADAVDAGSKRKHTDGESDEWSNNIGGGVVTVKREKVDEIGDAATATATAEATQGNEEENDDVGEDDDDDDEEEDLDAPPLMPFVSAFANCGPSSQVLPRLSRSSSKQLDALLSSEHEGSATSPANSLTEAAHPVIAAVEAMRLLQLLVEDSIAARGWLLPATEAALGGSSSSSGQSMTSATASSSAAGAAAKSSESMTAQPQAHFAYRELRAARATIQQCLAAARLPAFTTASPTTSNPSRVDLAAPGVTPSATPSAVTSGSVPAASSSSSSASSSSISGGVASPPGMRRLLKQAAVVAAVLQRKTDAANAAQLALAEEQQSQQQQQQQHYPQAATGAGGSGGVGGAAPAYSSSSSMSQQAYPYQRGANGGVAAGSVAAAPGGAAKADLKKLFSVLSSAKAQKLGGGGGRY